MNSIAEQTLDTRENRIAIIIAFILALSILLFSCESPVGFTEAQPSNAADLTSIPDAYKGMYICQSDSTLIKVQDRLIYSEHTELALTPMSYIAEREDCKIVNDTLYIEGQKECIKVEYPKEGYIAAVKVTRDTMFELSKVQKARMYKGNLILSQLTENDLWTIVILELDGTDGVRYRIINDDTDLKALSNITPVTDLGHNNPDYPQYKVAPKEVELDELFEDPTIFIECDYFSRVRITQ